MSLKPLRLIGITGLAGNGKDTVRRMLEENHEFVGLAFADPIRQMLGALLAENGISTEWMYERDLKERPIPCLGVSYRELAQRLGDWGRAISPDFWLRIAGEFIVDQRRQGERLFVISDVRFVNEAQWIKDAGGEVWRIDRPSAEPVRDHESERQVLAIQPDRVIDNSGTVEGLWTYVNDVLWDRRVAA